MTYPNITQAATELASAILKAAGTDLQHYTMQKSRDEIIGAAVKGLEAYSNQWQDIATAPRDNTRILVARFAPTPEAYDGFMAVDRWCRGAEDGHSYIGFGRFNEFHWPPTHWMHLPARPSAAIRKGGE